MRKLLAILLFLPLTAKADFWTGNDLYNKLSSSEVIERVNAIGYVVGIYDAGVNSVFCPKTEQGITAGQIRDMVHNWLSYNPQRRHEPAERLVFQIYKQNWPCPVRGSRI